MRECDGCQRCCQGYLIGTARGSWFGNLKPCKYLEDKCTIYQDRPSQCRNYYCAWKQGILPVWMKPDKINAVISVNNDENKKQFLNVMYTGELDSDVIFELNKFCTENSTYFKLLKIIPIESS